MADSEGDRTITAPEPPGAADQTPAALSAQPGDGTPTPPAAHDSQPGESVVGVAGNQSGLSGGNPKPVSSGEDGQPGHSVLAGSGTQMVELLTSQPGEQSILVGTEFTDLTNTTILYVQPDGSLVESSGLTAEEQQALLDQLTKQQVVQVSDTEAAQLLQQGQLLKPVHSAALDPSQLQQVINQVTKSQQQVHVQVPQQQVHIQVPKQQVHIQVPQQDSKQQVQAPQQNLKTPNNASQQLKSVAQQVAMQTSSSIPVVQKKVGHI